MMIKMIASIFFLPIWAVPVVAVAESPNMTAAHCEEIHGVLVEAYYEDIIDMRTVKEVSGDCYKLIERLVDKNPK